MTFESLFPPDPIAAVTFPDPYPFYSELIVRGLYRDEALGLWVAASAEAVTAVLASDLCRVRPPAEPVPRALVGSPAGEIFRHLVRMNDGPLHASCRQAVSAMLGAIGEAQAAAASRHWAGVLADELTGFHFRLPVYAVASLLGVPSDRLRPAADWMSDLVPALAPVSTPEQIERGQTAARSLWELFRSLYEGDAIIANAIGLLFQAHDATAGLIGNALVTLGRHPDVRDRVAHDPDLLPAVLLEVLRYDAPVQNTRRFVARDGIVAGQRMREGDAVLVVLAAANRDPAVNEDPELFDPLRGERRIFTFGAGVHACPGEALAPAIARAGVERLLRIGFDLERFADNVAYRPAANVRIPVSVTSLIDRNTPLKPMSGGNLQDWPCFLRLYVDGGRAPMGSWSRAELKMACLRRIAGSRERMDPFLLVDCVENYLQLEPREAAEFEALRSRKENQEVRVVAMTWSETQKAMGREEGLTQGAQRGARQLLLHQLGKRFGPLPENVRRRVEAITSLDRLTELAERVLSAHSLEEMGLA